jgi:prevent-host-death family protein
MTRITAGEFQRKFGEFQQRAQREPVEITRHGRRDLILMSAEHYDWLVAATGRAAPTTNTSETVLEAVRQARMDPQLAVLDALMKNARRRKE